MVSSSPDADNPLDPSVHYPLINSHPLTYSSMPLHMYPLTPNTQRSFSTKRRQVKNACTNCQRACKKCDDCRPCLRCVKYGVPAECVDSQRKERKKGVKRGPYKKRDCKDNGVELSDDSVQQQQQQPILRLHHEGPDNPSLASSSSTSSSPRSSLHYVGPYSGPTYQHHNEYLLPGLSPPPPPPVVPPRADEALAHQHEHEPQFYVVYPPNPSAPQVLSSQDFAPPAVQYYQQPPPGPTYHHPYPSYPPSYHTPSDPGPHQQPMMHPSYPFGSLDYDKAVDIGGYHLGGQSSGGK